MKEQLRELIKALGISQKAFGESIDIKSAFISDILNGRAKGFSSESLAAIHKAYHVNINWLLTGEGEMFLPEAPSKVMQSDAAKKNGLSGVDGGAEIFEGELNHTRWFRNLSPKKKVIAAALEELTEDAATRIVYDVDYEIRIEDRRKAEMESSEDKSLRQKGEAG